MTDKPQALVLADLWESKGKAMQTWVDENDYVEFGYRPDGLKKEQRDCFEAATELRRQHAEIQNLRNHIHTCGPNCSKAGCVNARLREVNLELQEQAWKANALNQELLEALKAMMRATQSIDPYVHAEASQMGSAAIAKAERHD